ncbi:MAG: peptidoglycan binding domain-containing protein [Roseburia sp.]|nr:peptidoglycan binding domain-containing protein [Roseburia sp.]
MKKSKSGLKIWIIAACIAAALIVVYLVFVLFFQSHFCFGTSIDGIDVGGCSVEEVKQLIAEEIDKYSLEISVREGDSEEVSGSSIGVEPVFNGEIEEMLEQQNSFAWLGILFEKRELELEKTVSYDEAALKSVSSKLSFMQKENQREPVDATCSEYIKGEGYVLIPADFGTTIKEQKFYEVVDEAIRALEPRVDLDKKDCYEEPAILDNDKKLLSMIEDLNHYADMTITYDFMEKTEVLDGEIISTWLHVEDWKVYLDEEAVLAYVKDLGKKYNTAYQPKTLETSYGTTVTISGGFYGWRIDSSGEMEQLLADLEAGEDVKREPVYLQTANSHGENDYGDSYVEINLTAQHLFLYEDGELVVESDFVSGDVADGNATPTGAFGLTYKTKNAILRGADYETPVTYWMPFYGDYGMHDATWRSKFGGNIYKTNGSHGCINMPLSVAKTIYEVVEKGYPVLVYTLPGTESIAVQKQDAQTVVNLINTIGIVTLESENAINIARNLYNALPESAREYVTNYDTLVAAEAALAQLKAEAQPAEQPAG